MRISSLPSLPAPPVWLRLVLQAFYPLFGIVMSLLFVVVAPFLLLLWPWDRRLAILRCLFLAVYIMWEDIGLVVECWYLRLRSPRGTSPTWDADHLALIQRALDNVLFTAKRVVGFHIEIEGELTVGRPGHPLVVISRHAGPADSLAIAWLLASTAGRIPRIVLADALLWDPGIAMVLQRLDSYFVPSRSGAGDDRTKGVAELASTLTHKDAMLIFPEGRNWTRDRHEDQVRRLREQGEPDRLATAVARPWVLEARSRGVASIRQHAPEADVMVIAHTGLDMISGPAAVIRAVPFRNRLLLRGRTYHSEDVPTDGDEVATWLDARWGEVNHWVDTHVSGREHL
ncbi:1-acyl-sn-glycerol-3-phosphate acyltransferase [Janibacter anophelis]|uniref:1-acyl-sn-glycerol-3-phosphate acyltransferase n=1 Tax=Janibacter anophelis TaxID=319054 RepID=UPI0009FF9DBF|nr:1-acyl-sn-glycerol-3-phosphate acyltransferase [Janibacter anophelis]